MAQAELKETILIVVCAMIVLRTSAFDFAIDNIKYIQYGSNESQNVSSKMANAANAVKMDENILVRIELKMLPCPSTRIL